jgi:hypothetical protein
VLLLAPVDTIGAATLAVAAPGGVRTVPLPLDAGTDPPAVAQPGLAVSPDGSRAVVVPGGSRVLDVDLRTLAVAERELSEPVSLLGRLRAWLEPQALAKGPLEGPVRSAAWLPGDRIAVAGWDYRQVGDRAMVSEAAGVRLIDTRDWSVRTLAEGATAVAARRRLAARLRRHAGAGGSRRDRPAGLRLRRPRAVPPLRRPLRRGGDRDRPVRLRRRAVRDPNANRRRRPRLGTGRPDRPPERVSRSPSRRLIRGRGRSRRPSP